MEKIRAKYGHKYNVIIPAEIRNKLGLIQGEYFDIYIEDNKIILERLKSDSDDDLVNEEDEKTMNSVLELSVKEKTMETNEEKSDLQKMLEDTKSQNETYWDRGVLKHKVKEDTDEEDDEDDEPKCECGNYIGSSRFIINGKTVCRGCRNALKEQMIMDINYHKRLKELNKR